MRIHIGVLLLVSLCVAAEESPANYIVVLQTNLQDARNRVCPIVLNVTRAMGPQSADRLWAMAGSKPPLLTEAGFVKVQTGSHVCFGISGKPNVNELWKGQAIVSDEKKVLNTRGTVAFMKEDPGTVLWVNMKDSPDMDKKGYAPFAEVIYGIETLETLHVPKVSDLATDQSLYIKYAQMGNAWLFSQDKDSDYITNSSLVVDAVDNAHHDENWDCRLPSSYGRVVSYNVPRPAVVGVSPSGGLGGSATAAVVILALLGAAAVCVQCVMAKRKQRRLKSYSNELSEQGVDLQLDDEEGQLDPDRSIQ